MLEFGAGIAASPLLRRVRHGDGHPVLILPGFMAGDPSTVPLRHVLRGQGYWTHGWRLGRNLGPTPEVVDGLVSRLDDLHRRHGTQVSLVGWSLGGIYARRLARRTPDKVRQVITLGSPFRMTDGDRSSASDAYERLRPLHSTGFDPGPGIADQPLPVPSTAIYTRTDGVVRWWQCLESVGPEHENIEVRGSHSGLGFNTAAVYAISDRLAQPAGDWHAFEPPRRFGQLFPPPADYTDEARTGRGRPVA